MFVICHLDDASYAFPLFVDNDFVIACPVTSGFVFRTIMHEDIVCVLFEIPTFAQVLNSWAAVRVRVTARKLRGYDERDVESLAGVT